MTRGRSQLLAAVVWGVVALDVFGVALVALGVLPDPQTGASGSFWIFVFLTLTYGAVGARIVTRDRRNRVGWVLWVQPTLLAVSGAGVSYAKVSLDEFAGDARDHPARLGRWLGLVMFVVLTALVIPLLFPTGRLPSRRWRPVAALVTTSIVLTMAGIWFLDAPLLPGLANPLGIPGTDEALALANQLGGVGIVLSIPLVIASVVQRFRRGTAVEREQVKWFALGVFVPALLLASALIAQQVELLWVAAVASLGLIPVTIGIAILRYRLYEIDRLVSRTIAWAIVTGVLVAVFAALVVTLQTLLAPVTRENTLAVAASTLIAFALFQPLRRRVQRAVDRRFDRARYDGQRTVDAFAERLRTEVDLPTLRESLAVTAGEAVRPATAGVWLTKGS